MQLRRDDKSEKVGRTILNSHCMRLELIDYKYSQENIEYCVTELLFSINDLYMLWCIAPCHPPVTPCHVVLHRVTPCHSGSTGLQGVTTGCRV